MWYVVAKEKRRDSIHRENQRKGTVQNIMKARNILYGYCYEGGKIVRCIEETKIVEEMSQAYLNGQSLLEIAESLNRYRVGTHGDGRIPSNGVPGRVRITNGANPLL